MGAVKEVGMQVGMVRYHHRRVRRENRRPLVSLALSVHEVMFVVVGSFFVGSLFLPPFPFLFFGFCET